MGPYKGVPLNGFFARNFGSSGVEAFGFGAPRLEC